MYEGLLSEARAREPKSQGARELVDLGRRPAGVLESWSD